MPETLEITTRGRYAIIAMVELAKADLNTPKPLSEIANISGLSLSYLEQLIAGLRRKGLVTSYRGPGGGYVLNRPASEIPISDILIAAEDSTPAKRGQSAPDKVNYCESSNQLWRELGNILKATLSHISLCDVVHLRLPHHPHLQKIFEIGR